MVAAVAVVLTLVHMLLDQIRRLQFLQIHRAFQLQLLEPSTQPLVFAGRYPIGSQSGNQICTYAHPMAVIAEVAAHGIVRIKLTQMAWCL